MSENMNAGTETDNGQAGIPEPVAPTGEPTGNEEAAAEATAEAAKSLFDGMTPEQLHKSYKELQREFGQRNERLKGYDEKFSQFGGADQLAQIAQGLSQNPRFQEWMKQEQTQGALGGLDMNNPEVKQAVDVVNALIETRLAQTMKTEVEPLREAYKTNLIKNHFASMDEKYGAEWRTMQDTMGALAERLPKETLNNPTVKDLEGLYWRALVETGKAEDFAAKMYAKKLEAKKSKSTERPASAGNVVPKGKMSLEQAFEAAKQSLKQ